MQKCTLLGLLVLLGSGCSSSGSGGNGGSATDASASDSSVADAGGASNDASSPNDASDASQSEASEDGSDGLLTCATSLTSACASAPAGYECPPSTESALPGTWCSSHPGAGALLGACGGYTALLETFIGTELVYLYAEQNLLSSEQLRSIVSDLGLDREYLMRRLSDNRRPLEL